MRRLSVCVGVLLVGCATAGTGQQAVRVEKREYHGWRDAYHLSNGTVDLVFVPQIGRIMRYGFAGQGSVLWENAALRGKVVAPEADAGSGSTTAATSSGPRHRPAGAGRRTRCWTAAPTRWSRSPAAACASPARRA